MLKASAKRAHKFFSISMVSVVMILGFTLFSLLAHAKSQSACFSLFNQNDEEAIKRPEVVLKDSDRLEIQRIFSDSDSTSAQKLQTSFQIYFDARLRFYSEDERDFILDQIKAMKIEFDDEIGLDKRIAKETKILLHQKLEGTLAFYLILAHEIEHNIQTSLLMISGENFIKRSLSMVKLILTNKYSARLRWVTERYALLSEIEFLSALPPDFVKSEIDRLQGEGFEETCKLLGLDLVSSEISQEALLQELQKRAGYTWEELDKYFKERRFMHLIIGIGSAAFGSLFWF